MITKALLKVWAAKAKVHYQPLFLNPHISFGCLARFLLLLPLMGAWYDLSASPSSDNSLAIGINVDHAILLTGVPGQPLPSSNLSAEVNGAPGGEQYTYEWKQVQDVMSTVSARMDKGKLIQFSSPATASTKATFPDWGVYEVKLTVTDKASGKSTWRHAWINVWDARSHILKDGKPDPLFAAPGINPPLVRNLTPDPGPFHHPRLYTTDRDWAEINDRIKTQNLPRLGLEALNRELTQKFEAPTSQYAKLNAELLAYADSNYTSPPPDLTMGIPAKNKDGKSDWSDAYNNLISYYDRLKEASLAAWLKVDPLLPQEKATLADRENLQKLAKILAAVCHLHLKNCWNIETGEFHKDYPLDLRLYDPEVLTDTENIALAYDFLYRWMTPKQAAEVRNFIFATGVGRTPGGRHSPDVVNGYVLDHGIVHGPQNNGDFMNSGEERILSAMAIEGEESAVDPRIVKTFTDLPKPKDFETSGKCTAYDWAKYVTVDTGGTNSASKPYPEESTWPNARKVQVDSLQRAIWWSDEWYTSPWGFCLNRLAYYGYSSHGLWPAAMAYARHGCFNSFVASYYYQTVLHHLWSYYVGESPHKSPHFSSNLFLYDHHDGSWCSHEYAIILKYMYPDDPAVDMVYSPYAPIIENRIRNPFITVLFGTDPGIKGKPTSMEEMANAKALPLAKADPQIGLVVARSGWKDDDLLVYLDVGWSYTGHQHAEKNSFSFFAKGRAWSIAPGYHIASSSAQAGILIQDPASAKDELTEGYVGQGPSLVPQGSHFPHCFPTTPGRLVEVAEGPGHDYTLMVGDAKIAYNYSYNKSGEGSKPILAPFTREECMYPGAAEEFFSRVTNGLTRQMITTAHNDIGWDYTVCPDYNPVRYAFRSILLVRGKHPYMLIVDDFSKDDKPENYRWTMNCCLAFEGSDGRFIDAKGTPVPASLIMAPNPTATECTLLHLPDQGNQPGLPRLLVRDVSESPNTSQPVIKINTQSVGTEHNHTVPSDRLFIDRNNVVDPKYKLLFYPYNTGERLPTTTWDDHHQQLTVSFPDGSADVITFDSSNPDHRTRMHFSRKTI
jgi:hypothetical protein